MICPREVVEFNMNLKPIMIEALTKSESTCEDLRDHLLLVMTDRLRESGKSLSKCLEATTGPGIRLNALIAACKEQCRLIHKDHAKMGNK